MCATKYYYESLSTTKLLSDNLSKYLAFLNRKEIIILCIGTDRATGDCVGPLVGWFLNKEGFDMPIYGTLSDPVHAMNLEDTMKEINHKYENPAIIAIDAWLGG